jgi:putative molybdopterin biosynthesis protein
MKARGVHLEYRFTDEAQRGADLAHPLFDLLQAVHANGSIQHAARALGASYRHVWGALRRWEAELGEPLVVWAQGQPARLTPFADRLLWAERRARTRLAPHIEALRAELQHVLAEALDGSQQVLTVHASHDLALPLLRELAATQGLHVELRFAGSMDALRALAEGRCTVAGFHVPPLADARNLFARALKPLLVPGRHKLIGFATRRHGLVVPPGNPQGLHTLADLCRPAAGGAARFVPRQPGSGTRLLTEHLLAQHGLDAAALPGFLGPAEDSHLAVATAVADAASRGQPAAGLAIQAAAERVGLGFVPLVDEHYFLVCLHDVLEHPAVQRLRMLLQSAAWAERLATLPGYAPDRAGEVLSLTQALPWWRFRGPRGGAGRA